MVLGERTFRKVKCDLSLSAGNQELLLPHALVVVLLVQGEAVEEGSHLNHARLNDAAKLLWVDVQPTSLPTHSSLVNVITSVYWQGC
jgi:hypothetical protein